MSNDTPSPKRHHYVPVSYLARFTDEDGFLTVYRKDDPSKPIRSKPQGIAFRRYYYSQPVPGGGYNHDRFERGLAELENGWSQLAARISAGENINNHEDLENLLGFIALQRVRVPAARDMAERAYAHVIMQELRGLDAAGKLDPKPKGFENILDLVGVTVDPHQSIHAMAHQLPHLGGLFDSIGYEILHNDTELSFITSDNPVIYFDPSAPEKEMRPYAVHVPLRPMELLFPVDPTTVVRGHSDLRNRFVGQGLRHSRLRDMKAVRRINRLTARFGYELLIARDQSHASLMKQYAAKSPVLASVTDGSDELTMIFGQRVAKPKWKRRSDGQ
jgi:hypothetical protein